MNTRKNAIKKRKKQRIITAVSIVGFLVAAVLFFVLLFSLHFSNFGSISVNLGGGSPIEVAGSPGGNNLPPINSPPNTPPDFACNDCGECVLCYQPEIPDLPQHLRCSEEYSFIMQELAYSYSVIFNLEEMHGVIEKVQSGELSNFAFSFAVSGINSLLAIEKESGIEFSIFVFELSVDIIGKEILELLNYFNPFLPDRLTLFLRHSN